MEFSISKEVPTESKKNAIRVICYILTARSLFFFPLWLLSAAELAVITVNSSLSGDGYVNNERVDLFDDRKTLS